MNDDLVQAHRGFGMHPHRDVEIVTYIVDGVLTHQDSTGTCESLGRGSVQFMSAGQGIMHSEHNHEDAPLRFVQIWINTRRNGIEPEYGGFDGTTSVARAARTNSLAQLVGDRNQDRDAAAPVKIEQDARMFVSELEPGKTVSLPLPKGRQAYLLCVEGAVTAREAAGGDLYELVRHDAAEIRGDGTLDLSASAQGAHVLLLEMAASSQGGRGPGKWPLHM
jgi:redox-sensitive bicupin YhaK (pirin superfamily)